LGGACVAAPFLSSLGARGVKAQSAAAPRRLLVMWTHFGCITTRFFPVKSHGPLAAEDLKATTLAPLVPYAGKLLMPRGIRSMNEWTTDMTRGQGNDTFLDAAGSYFTCQPVTPNSDDPFSFDTTTKFNAKPLGPSLDHVIAKQLSPGGTPLFIRVSNRNDTPASCISYSDSQTPYAGLGTPAAVWSGLTGFLPGGSSPDGYQLSRGKSILDLIEDDLATLERADLSRADKSKLEAWKTLLHETTRAVVPAACSDDLAGMLQLSDANVAAASSSDLGSDPLTTKVTAGLDVADIYSNLAVLAAVCNANPVIFLKYPTSYVWKGLGITIESASLSHRADNAAMSGSCFPDAIKDILAIDGYYAAKFTHLVGTLDSIDEGDGTVLDNSAAVWFQEVSDGCARNLNNLPIVQAGSMGGYFKTGWAVNVEDGSADLTRGNSEAQCAGGTSDEQYDALTQETGTPASLANAPINKYYCNLMNGLGVKAGADGFPAPGGTAEVTKFGMYDRTQDFVHGGTNPPLIHDPGEFTALKASS
jgi:hypothetical protein